VKATAAGAERVVQALLVLGVGVVAGAASWSHAHALAVQHGQTGWLAWADAAVLETMAVSAGLELRRRHAAGRPVRAVLAVLLGAVAIQLAAQVADAEASVWGWTMAALPCLGSLVLIKMALAAAGPQVQVRSGTGPDLAEESSEEAKGSAGDDGLQAGGRPTPELHPEVDELVEHGLRVVQALEAGGRPLTRVALVRELRAREVRLSTDKATDLLRTLRSMEAAAS
jgi:hypothetical protein